MSSKSQTRRFRFTFGLLLAAFLALCLSISLRQPQTSRHVARDIESNIVSQPSNNGSSTLRNVRRYLELHALLEKDEVNDNAQEMVALPFGRNALLGLSYRKRAISQEAWQKKVDKGFEMLCDMTKPIDMVPQSPYLKQQDFVDWGWQEYNYIDSYKEMSLNAFNVFFTAEEFMAENGYKWNANDPDSGWNALYMEHDVPEYTPPGETELRKATMADLGTFTNTANEDNGLMALYQMHSAEFRTGQTADQNSNPNFAGKLPDLKRTSDIAALIWSKTVNGPADGTGQMKAPRWILIPGITSRSATDTRDTIDKALELVGTPLNAWPGYSFDTHTEAGKALLGTQHGQGPAFMLIQHKAWFGNMRIDKIVAYRSPFTAGISVPEKQLWTYNMLFSVVAA